MRKTVIKMHMVEFKNALLQVQGAMAVRDVRYYLNAIHIETVSKGWVRLVAADGHRLHCSDAVKSDIYHDDDAPMPEKEWLIPGETLNIVKSLLNRKYGDNVAVEFTDQRCKVSALINPYCIESPKNLTFEIPSINGTYPEFKEIIKESFSGNTFKCETQILLDALVVYKAKLPKNKVQNIGITFDTDNDQSLILDYVGNPIYTQSFTVPFSSSSAVGETVRTGMNLQYLIDALKSVKTKMVQFTYSADRGSLAFETTLNRDSGHYGLVMSCRVPDKDVYPVEDA